MIKFKLYLYFNDFIFYSQIRDIEGRILAKKFAARFGCAVDLSGQIPMCPTSRVREQIRICESYCWNTLWMFIDIMLYVLKVVFRLLLEYAPWRRRPTANQWQKFSGKSMTENVCLQNQRIKLMNRIVIRKKMLEEPIKYG